MIKEFKLIEATSPESLSTQINTELKKGWNLYKSVVIHTVTDGQEYATRTVTYYTHAMVKI